MKNYSPNRREVGKKNEKTELTKTSSKFPEARIIGNDLSAIQPAWVPPNLEFVIDDFEKEWIYDKDHFDFVHARTIAGCVRDWPWLIRQIYDHLKPGGYVEFAEFPIWAYSDDATLEDDSPYMQYLRNLQEAGERIGRTMKVAENLKQWAEQAGFEDLVEKVYKVPLGPWAKDPKLKELGRWAYIEFPEGVDAYGLRLYTQVLGWASDVANIHLALVKEQLRSRSVHAYVKL